MGHPWALPWLSVGPPSRQLRKPSNPLACVVQTSPRAGALGRDSEGAPMAPPSMLCAVRGAVSSARSRSGLTSALNFAHTFGKRALLIYGWVQGALTAHALRKPTSLLHTPMIGPQPERLRSAAERAHPEEMSAQRARNRCLAMRSAARPGTAAAIDAPPRRHERLRCHAASGHGRQRRQNQSRRGARRLPAASGRSI